MSAGRTVLKSADGRVKLKEHDVLVDHVAKLSYEAYLDGKTVRRFLYIDLGENNKDIAMAWTEGLMAGLRLARV